MCRISPRDKQRVVASLNKELGASEKAKDDNYKFHCPFCQHRKKKLEVDISSQKWNCWVCNTKGRSILSLYNRIKVPKESKELVKSIYTNSTSKSTYVSSNDDIQLTLPKEFQSLIRPSSQFDPDYKLAKHYLNNVRGISDNVIKKYNIGYCTSGNYNGYLIIPSYDSTNQLNYFVARSFIEDNPYSYKNPPVSKNTIIFESQINWNEPITLVEGMFDAIAIRRNAIPTLGTVIPQKLMEAIFMNDVKTINMMYDADAKNRSLYYTNYFMANDIEVKNIIPETGDPADIGFKGVHDLFRSQNNTTWEDVVFSKLG